MQTLKIFSIYDSKAESYDKPYFALTTGLAIRAITDAINHPEPNNLNIHPADFTIFEIGEFDSASGVVKPYKALVNLGTCLQYKNAVPKPEPITPLPPLTTPKKG